MEKWVRLAPGIRCREHATRKHGPRPDRYFCLRYTVGGKHKTEGLGWQSEGWSLSKAQAELVRLKEAIKTGHGPQTMAERRKEAEAKRKALAEAQEKERQDALTFAEAFLDHYLPHTSQTKSARSLAREQGLFKLWLEPVVGSRRLAEIAPIHLERVRRNMREAGLSPRSLHYAMQVVRQTYHHAERMRLYGGPAPTKEIKGEKRDARRLRFLTHEEADGLLVALGPVSPDLQAMALLSLHTGMRAGEIFALTWADVDMGQGMLTLRDTKSGRSRHVYMTADVKAMLNTRPHGEPGELVFPARGGARRLQISKRFSLAVDSLGLNDGITDARQKVVFHTLRHSFASWLAMEGTPLFTIGKLLGHQTSAMTERYSHLAPDHLREAVNGLERSIKQAKQGKALTLAAKE